MSNHQSSHTEAPLTNFDEMGAQNNPRADLADVSNAPYLFGDPFGDVDENDDFGDADDPYGDAIDDPYGDADPMDIYGDINDDPAATFSLISGDPKTKLGRFIKKNKKGLLIGAGALAAGGLTYAAIRAIKARKARMRAINNRLQSQRLRETIRTQAHARKYMGKLNPNGQMPFMSLSGAYLNSAPIDAMSSFVGRTLQYNLDKQASDTPFLQETAIGTFIGPNWNAVANGSPTIIRYYTTVIVQIGINALSAAPATVASVSLTMPLINGQTLDLTPSPLLITIKRGFEVKLVLFPWQLVANRPEFTLGQYGGGGASVVLNVTGVPAQSAVNLIIPGSRHPWVIATRNAFLR